MAVPAAADRNEIVLTGADGRLDVRDNDLWAGSLPDELRGLIADELWRAAKATDVYAAPVPQGALALPQYRVSYNFV